MPKTIIFLLDGTANDATVDSFSNVYAINQLIDESKLIKSAKGSKRQAQITFYMPGVGTKFTVKRAIEREKKGILSIGARTDTVRQQIFGDDLEQLILRAYVNLCANYREGDDVIIVGFSRGAAAARIFSRLISDFGILTSDLLLFLDRLWNEFVEISNAGTDADYRLAISKLKAGLRSEAGREAFHGADGNGADSVGAQQPQIRFLGLFDTVIGPFDADVPRNLNLRDQYPASSVRHIVHLLSMHDVRSEYELKRFLRPQNLPETLREIWLPGVHADVGGGYTEDLLSSISLLTMADLLEELGGVAINKTAYALVAEKIKRRVSDQRYVINKEPLVASRKNRSVNDQDELHPAHWFLVGKSVFWKQFDKTRIYENRTAQNPGAVERALDKQFQTWVAAEERKLAKKKTTARKGTKVAKPRSRSSRGTERP
ncbi:T6SS phospholipase effector Tle1-like catalytic domain-containing protein [Bradyrhizobium symbiodeficiens]|uniref:T6SS phospholipase effector Tle1-like catalytic domain-containing protein n=1 Tax=Bradyrhizobium symbiodeficiens TaxID=1404367 RepID=UPI00140F6AE1|nr:DUF2235 domain-containing protein [Bradyrhizobium symbiodeficiens]QIP03370.1 DUF2235 domain-containing protein [Bradyrhizobium symbiodeficiens]